MATKREFAPANGLEHISIMTYKKFAKCNKIDKESGMGSVEISGGAVDATNLTESVVHHYVHMSYINGDEGRSLKDCISTYK